MKPSEFDALANLFAKSSNGFKRANPQLVPLDKHREIKTRSMPQQRALMGEMNKTEWLFSVRLMQAQLKGEIRRWVYEGMTLRWQVGDEIIKYTPDFTVFPAFPGAPIMLIEVKGGFTGGKFERAVERFRHARSVWPEFGFQLWQYKNKEWKKKF